MCVFLRTARTEPEVSIDFFLEANLIGVNCSCSYKANLICVNCSYEANLIGVKCSGVNCSYNLFVG